MHISSLNSSSFCHRLHGNSEWKLSMISIDNINQTRYEWSMRSKKRYGKSKILEESWSRSIPILLARIFWLWIFSLFIRNLQKRLSKLMMMTLNEFYKRDRHRYYIRIRKNEFISTLYHEIIIFPISKTLDTSRNHIQWRNNHFTISNSVFLVFNFFIGNR